jgi:alpha-tubulin suppressor-like RCC1 family protein
MLNRPWNALVALAALTAAVGIACGDGGTAPTPTPVATHFEIVGADSFTGTVGGQQDLRVRVRDQNNAAMSGVTVTFAAQQGSVAPATVVTDAEGHALTSWTFGTTAGTQTATASTAGLGSLTFTATVSAGAAAEITIAPASVALEAIGQTAQLTAQVRDSHGNAIPNADVQWTTANASVVTVSATGLVTAVGLGSTTVRARVGTSNVQAVIPVSVALPPASIVVAPQSHDFQSIGETAQFTAIVRDAGGTEITGASVTWSSTNTSVVTVSTTGLATSRGTGTARIIAQSGAVADTADVSVTQVVTAIVVDPTQATIETGDTVRVSAQARDARGTAVPGVTLTWSSTDESVATVTQAGLVTGVGAGTATIQVSGGGQSATVAIVVVAPVQAVSVSVSGFHSCAVAADGRAFCWGYGPPGMLGSGTATDSFPRLVSGNHRYDEITTGFDHTCALREDGAALCWGQSYVGMLGNGGTTATAAPVLVSGGHQYTQIESGNQYHTCAVRTDGRLFCWGFNEDGQLGVAPGGESCTLGTTNYACRKAPVEVTGGRTYQDVAVGAYHTCGVTTGGDVYCWGWNGLGQLGDGTTADSYEPVQVAGTGYVGVAAGFFHSCAYRADGSAFCWGMDEDGQLGSNMTAPNTCTLGTNTYRCSLNPFAVLGGLSFSDMSAGAYNTCGVVTGDDAYCWGWNGGGSLGDGTTTDRAQPRKTIGPAYTEISVTYNSRTISGQNVGQANGCAISEAGFVYCWGSNGAGQLGNGSTASSMTPVRAVLPHPAAATEALSDPAVVPVMPGPDRRRDVRPIRIR